ncbi:DUF378 domain-containing protein [Intestinibacter sp.]|uniref:DUF378 domain-containing protein n=1 Tax=Intestinibacter sp. TaxID=1965304 RepID=UPI002A753B9C|nr:DUF378 domain-containing protein [Intestinibacter sp.]MDY2736576.1 DUF378 domain-containing protein [Intestinibacter sp.]MDY4574197.1 DUF378 domain-containing protein [Intestinibacter sp.]
MLKKIALLLVIIGAFNWGCVGIFGLDVIGYLFGGTYSMISRIIYTLVGLAGVYLIPSLMTKNTEE